MRVPVNSPGKARFKQTGRRGTERDRETSADQRHGVICATDTLVRKTHRVDAPITTRRFIQNDPFGMRATWPLAYMLGPRLRRRHDGTEPVASHSSGEMGVRTSLPSLPPIEPFSVTSRTLGDLAQLVRSCPSWSRTKGDAGDASEGGGVEADPEQVLRMTYSGALARRRRGSPGHAVERLGSIDGRPPR